MLSLIVALLVCAATWFIWRFLRAYIEKSPLDNIPGLERTSFLTGNTEEIFYWDGWDLHDRIGTTYPGVCKYTGFLGARGLFVFDPLALHHIILKDQAKYSEAEWMLEWTHSTLGPCLLATTGEHHRRQRKMLNPVFSIAHLRGVTPIFYKSIRRLETAVKTQVGRTTTDVDVLHWMSRAALELIGQAGLGYSFDPLTENVTNNYAEAVKGLVTTTFALYKWLPLFNLTRNIGTPGIRREAAKWLPHATMQHMRQLVTTANLRSNQIYHEKKIALERGDDAVVHQIGEGKDIMSILMKANMVAEEKDRLPDDEVIAQMTMFCLAATDTTSNALARTFQLLARHQDIQDKVRAELLEAGHDGEDIPYDQLVELPYLDAICRESLRLHPPAPTRIRAANQDTILPLSRPITGVDGSTISEIVVPKGTPIALSIRSCNRYKAIWGEDALEFKPERWLEPLPTAVTEAPIPGVYSHLMTFYGGSRSCIGFKFSQLEMKVVLAVLLRSFKFHSSNRDIHWAMAGVNYPTVERGSMKGSMPMRLEPLKA